MAAAGICANARITRIPPIASARLPTIVAIAVRVARNARRARREKISVATIITGTTAKVVSASSVSMTSMATTMPISTRESPMICTSPCDSTSLMVATSLITREMVTPTGCSE